MVVLQKNVMDYAIVTVPLAPIRKEPDHRKEMTNELFFGETVRILRKKDEIWFKVESLYDNYVGWITHHLINPVKKADVDFSSNYIAPLFLTPITIAQQTMHLPQGATLPNLIDEAGEIAGVPYAIKEAPIDTNAVNKNAKTLISNAMQWLNAPYLWGGKTILGVDCSGFCQTMYKLIGMPIARDAKQQAKKGINVKTLNDVFPGDLAFFDEKDKITHVGILMGNNKIIHASGKVRIDIIDNTGIINRDTGKRTHHLKKIRRFLP